MEKAGSILHRLGALKDTLDQVNKEIESEIQRTREIESKIVLCFKKEKDLLTKEAELLSVINSKEFQLNNLMTMLDISKKAFDMTEEVLACEEKSRNEVVVRIGSDREEFINLCRQYQLNSKTTKMSQAYKRLLLTREYLEQKIVCLKKAMKDHCVIEEKNDLKPRSFIHGFQDEIYIGNFENEKLFNDVDVLKIAFQDISNFEDISWMQIQICSREEEKRQLEDCIMGFQIQLSCVLEEEQRLANAYKEQLMVLQLPEHGEGNLYSHE